MTVTLKEATDKLLRGESLEWLPQGTGLKGGKITLADAGPRRLLAYLLDRPQDLVANADESLFAGLVEAWGKNDDPAEKIVAAEGDVRDRWLLKSVRTFNFGGLNAFGGDEFLLPVEDASWCLEGQNGSGKTSLASAVLWGLTGRRIREHAGIVEDSGKREPVLGPGGDKIGDWPPLVAFPKTREELLNDAEVRVELTFMNEAGDEAVARRRIVSPGLLNDSVDEREVDPRLLTAPQLLEAGILMPCRLSVLRFGEGSTHLYDAVKMLTGLDQLSAVGDGAANLRHGAKKFMKYAKDKGIEAIRSAFVSSMKTAAEQATKVGVDISGQSEPEKADPATLRRMADEAKAGAAAQMATLAADLGAGGDINTDAGREAMTKAAVLVAEMLEGGFGGLAPVKALDAAVAEQAAGSLAGMPAGIEAAEEELAEAILWHARQQADVRLRLKAVAAPWFEPRDDGGAECPLCEAELKTEAQKALAGELARLKAVGDAAERKLADACRDLSERLGRLVPTPLRPFRSSLAGMEPKAAVTDAITNGFTKAGRFEDVLVGAGKALSAKVEGTEAALPSYSPKVQDAGDDPADVAKVRLEVAGLRHILGLAAWWLANRDAFIGYWDAVVGVAGEDGRLPGDSLSGRLAIMKAAIGKAEPYGKLADSLGAAAKKAEESAAIMKEQKVRDDIAAALEPLTLLKNLVDAETARSVSALSDRIGDILGRIHHRERLTYEGAALKKERTTREVNVHAGFRHAPDMKIDAGLVANTSWLRAILWGFIFALREETVEGLGYNPFPLMLLDDPQATFDPRNKRSWAEELSRLSNLAPDDPNWVQLFLTTHERQFFDMLEVEQCKAERGHILGLVPDIGHVLVSTGTEVERYWEEAEKADSDEKAATFIGRLRGHCEAILKIVLQGYLTPMASHNLKTLRETMDGLRKERIAPFTFPHFGELITLLGRDDPHIRILNDQTHNPGDANVATAKRLKAFWDGDGKTKCLKNVIFAALQSYREFRAYKGDHRAYMPAAEIVPLPSAQKEEIRRAVLNRTGVAAAAMADGRVPFGDGRIRITEEPGDEVRLGNHDLFRLTEGTLEPVAGVGDFLIVGDGAAVRPGNLVVASVGDRILARRLTVPVSNPDVAVLVAQAIDPTAIGMPVIVPLNGFARKKVVGVLFSGDRRSPEGGGHEAVPVGDPADYWSLVDKGRLFRVEGRSAEPLALEGQYLIAGERVAGAAELSRLDSRLVIAVDGDGGCYFKRLRVARGGMAVLESLNPDGTCPSELMSLDGEGGFPKLESAYVVRGVLFELPR